jgi:CelD/BcsL family acetyltransferase involved in cellulose biosynthesis
MTARLIQLDSVDDIRSAAAEWNDLWQRSDVALPIARAELIANWLDWNASRAAVSAVAIEEFGRFVAALPLTRGRLKRTVPISRIPRNDWSWAGDLLLDPAIDAATLEMFAKAVARIGRPLVWLDAVPFNSEGWQRFAAAADNAGLSPCKRESFRVGRIEIDHNWPAYERSWSKNHRRRMRRVEREAKSLGGATLVVHRQFEPREIEPLLRRGFEIEDLGWKGRARSSALSWPGVFEFYLEQARQIALLGQLQIAFLEVGDRPIAFEYGWNAKGIYHSFKVGYDEAFARIKPGQLLRLQLLRRFFADPAQRVFDFLGPICEATAKWLTSSYPVGRFALSGSCVGRFLIGAYRSLRPQVGVPPSGGRLRAKARTVAREKTAPGGQAKSPSRRAPTPLT